MSITLRELVGLPTELPSLAESTLIMIDYQNTYTTGVMELHGAEEALDAAARLLERARNAGAKIVHIVNDGGPSTPYDVNAEIGAIHPKVAPRDGEPVVVKGFPNAFHDTTLSETLKELGSGPDLVLAGFMTHMCVTFTAQGAFNLGHRVTVVADACATRSLPVPTGGELDAEALHTAALTTLGDLFAQVTATAADLPA